MESRIEFRTERVENGWSDFTVSLGASSWKCCASYLSAHPLVDMIHTAVDLYDHIFVAPMPEESSTWDITACDEPGGLLIRITSIARENRVSVFRLDDDGKPQDVPIGEGTMEYWQFADAVFEDAARTVARYGFTNFRDRWFMPRWDADSHGEALPIEHFLYLAALIERRKPVSAITLEDEIGLLRKIQKRLETGARLNNGKRSILAFAVSDGYDAVELDVRRAQDGRRGEWIAKLARTRQRVYRRLRGMRIEPPQESQIIARHHNAKQPQIIAAAIQPRMPPTRGNMGEIMKRIRKQSNVAISR